MKLPIKKIQLKPDQRELLRNLLDQCIWSHEEEIKNGGYTESGIIKATRDIYTCAQIIEKLNFDVLVEKPEIDYYEDFDTHGYEMLHGKWVKYSDIKEFINEKALKEPE